MTVVIVPVRQGKPNFSEVQRKVVDQAFRELEGRDAKIEIGRDTRPRSLKQNRYYWGVVIAMIAAETGHTPKEMHAFFSDRFLEPAEVTVGKFKAEVTPSTTDIDTIKFIKYTEEIRVFAAENLNLDIPNPKAAGYA